MPDYHDETEDETKQLAAQSKVKGKGVPPKSKAKKEKSATEKELGKIKKAKGTRGCCGRKDKKVKK